ncbi:MAG: hypothetical protein ACKVU1_15800 [bacterium]
MHTHSALNSSSIGLAMLLALAALSASCASTNDTARLRRGTIVSVPDTVAVEHFKQGIGDLIGRVVLLGLSRTGNCKVYDGGILRVISERPGPGGEVKVAYYRANVPASRRDQCEDGTILEVLDSDLRFYQAFFDLKQKALESIRASVAGIDTAHAAAIDSVNVNESWVSRGDVVVLSDESIVTVASPGAHDPGDSMFVQTGGDCRICPPARDGVSAAVTRAGSASPAPPAPPYKVVKGFLPYVDPRSGKAATAVVWDYYANATLSTRAGKQECATGTRFLEPDIIAGTMAEMHEMFLRHNLSDMQRLVSGLGRGLAARP